jgi:fatty acid desaturase
VASAHDFARPRLPPEYRDIEGYKSAAVIVFGFAMFLVPASLAGAWVTRELPLLTRAALVLPLAFLAGHGMHVLGILGHEGIHLNLHRNRRVSLALAILCSAPVPSYLVIGYALTHWTHHRFTNQLEDPDRVIYAPCETFWKRLLVSRSRGNRRYARDTLALARRHPLRELDRPPFTFELLVRFARLNLLASGLVWSSYVALAMTRPSVFLAAVLAPALFAYGMSGLRAYVEHAGTTVGAFRDTRSFTAPLFTLAFLGNNFHLEHHLYPAVPCYKLPALHRYLTAQGAHARAGSAIERTVRGVGRYTTRRFQYAVKDASVPHSS